MSKHCHERQGSYSFTSTPREWFVAVVLAFPSGPAMSGTAEQSSARP